MWLNGLCSISWLVSSYFSTACILSINLEAGQLSRHYVHVAEISLNVTFKVIRHVFGFGIEFLEIKGIGILGHFIVINFIKRYSYHTYFSPISTSRFRRFGSGCIARNGEWCIFVDYSVFSALFSLKLCILFEEGILGTPVQKNTVPPILISNYHR